MILVILQNAWYHRNKKKSYEHWLIALWRSRTGRMLIKMLPEGVPYFVINSTDEVTDNPSDALKANFRWIRKHMLLIQPTLVLACGKVAQGACYMMGIEHIKAPHPAWRRLSNEMAAQIKGEIKEALE